MNSDSQPLEVSLASRPADHYEMTADRLPGGQLVVKVQKLGKFGKRDVYVRDAGKHPPTWEPDGMTIQFAGQSWVPANHADAIAWMNGTVASDDTSPSAAATWAESPSARPAMLDAEQQLVSLRSVGNVLKSLAVVVGCLGLLGGLLLAMQTDSDGFDETRPYVVAGISLACSSAFGALVAFVIGSIAVTYATVNLGRQPIPGPPPPPPG